MGFSRKYLSADGLHQTVFDCFKKKFARRESARMQYSGTDCLMTGLALFGLKYPSLLKFELGKANDRQVRHNLKTLYHVATAPCDTTLRERLDEVLPRAIRPAFKQIFAHLQRGKALESYRYLEGYYIISLDGTGQYRSEKVHCDNCCVKKHRDGKVTYYHHLLGAVLVHPDKRAVIPLAPEPIIKEDGDNKNDCERNAAKRLLADLRREHAHLKVLIVEDALASNYPHLTLLDSLHMAYVIGIKPGDHSFLFDWISHLQPQHVETVDKKGVIHTFNYYKNVPLNEAHFDYEVQVMDYWETKPNGTRQHFTWVTRLALSDDNVYALMRAGRSRWHIENETFNTLKNQGYEFEHNFGHGYKNLCSVMTMLMMLAFLIDQVQALCCEAYQRARTLRGSLSDLFERVRALFCLMTWQNWEQIYLLIGTPNAQGPPCQR